MSPLWRDQIRIALCPDKVVLVRIARGWRPQIADKRIIPCGAAPTSESPWHLPLMALKESLPAFADRSADAVTIISNGFVRYVQVPWNAQLTGEEEELAYARHCFAKTYGDNASNLELRLSRDAVGAPRIASAVDRRLLDGLTSTLREGGLHCGSVQPYLMAAFNQWRPNFKDTTAWFALVEGGKICLTLLHQDRWHSLRILNAGPDWREKFPLILNREQHLVDVSEAPHEVFLFAPEEIELPMAVDMPWSIHRLALSPRQGFSPQTEAAYSLAVSG